jgi:hypothetical protein
MTLPKAFPVVAGLAGLAGSLSAQQHPAPSSASVSVAATVVPPAQGGFTRLHPSKYAAGWRVTRAPRGAVVASFELPLTLRRSGSPGAATLPIEFATEAGGVGTALDVRLGGTVAPPPKLPGGTYGGVVTLTLLYL